MKSDAAGPERLWTVNLLGALKVVAVVLTAMGVLLLLYPMRGRAMAQAVIMGMTKAMAAVEELGPRTTTMAADAGLDRGGGRWPCWTRWCCRHPRRSRPRRRQRLY